MFWKKTAREEKRQVVLDELIEMDPDKRRRRLELAVSEGDVRPAEVDQALRLVNRLDALRVMSIPGRLGAADPAPETKAASVEAESADQTAQSKGRMRRRHASRRRARSIRVPAEFAAGNGSLEKVAALRRASRAIGMRPRRSRPTGAVGIAVAAAPVVRPITGAADPAEAGVLATGTDSSSGAQRPDISWLRP